MKGNKAHEMFDCVPEIDYDSGFRYFLGNVQNYSRALLSILKSIKSKMPIMRLMLQSGEYEGLRSITQTLQKMFSNIGAHGLAEASYQLEKALLNDEIDARSELLVDYLEQLFLFSEHLELLFKNTNFKNPSDLAEDTASYFHYDFTKTKESIKRTSDLLGRKII
jgi:HPt (histidine-containing phosphotransfer) domain-containing protein